LVWGEGQIANTCPMDNAFSLVVFHNNWKDDVLEKLPENTETEKSFKTTAQFAIQGNSAMAHKHWNNYLFKNNILKSENNLYGEPGKIVYEPLLKGAYLYTVTCSEGCTKNAKLRSVSNFSISQQENAKTKIECLELGNFLTSNCTKCKQPIQTSKISIAEGRNPYIFNIELYGCRSSPKVIADTCPDQITIHGRQFKLAMITINQRNRDHFISVVKTPSGKWITYDGIRSKGQTREPCLTDWQTPDSVPQLIDYVLHH